MAWRIVKQPNGRFARFSDIVDNFTHYEMSEDDVIDLCINECSLSKENAELKLGSAKDDIKPYTSEKGSGHDRWDDCLKTIRIIHGKKEMNKIKASPFLTKKVF